MIDVIETIGQSIIQHGSSNDRVYLMKLHLDDTPQIVEELEQKVTSGGYSKVFAKVPAWSADRFLAAGYQQEASIPEFFTDGAEACFLGKYFTTERGLERKPQLVQEVLGASQAQGSVRMPTPLPKGFTARVATEEDANEMAEVYSEVFATYPFPIHDPGFLKAAMNGNTVFFGIWKDGEIVALSSAEMDPSSRSVEMTDFATLQEYRGHGLALNLLQQMEETVYSRGIRTLFTIARAYSYGMNITFARDGYRFGGTLTNNTNISGSLESMNVWYKTLA